MLSIDLEIPRFFFDAIPFTVGALGNGHKGFGPLADLFARRGLIPPLEHIDYALRAKVKYQVMRQIIRGRCCPGTTTVEDNLHGFLWDILHRGRERKLVFFRDLPELFEGMVVPHFAKGSDALVIDRPGGIRNNFVHIHHGDFAETITGRTGTIWGVE